MLEALHIQVARSTQTRAREDWYEHVTLNIGYYTFSLFQLNIVILCCLLQEADMKHEVDPAEFFVYRHKYKQGPKKGEWVECISNGPCKLYRDICMFNYVTMEFLYN
jgi:hypothetical protein